MLIKTGTELRLVLQLTDATTAQPKLNVQAHTVSCTVLRADGTFGTYTPTPLEWTEVVTDNFSGSGTYVLTLPASSTSVSGELTYRLNSPTCASVGGSVEVIAHSSEDIYENTQDLCDATFGKMIIDTSTKRMTLFQLDGTSVLAVFELQDESGVPSVLRPFRRIPV